ncbi:P-loop containing nucleoside triphosphate hydrolase protein, partial [Mariannaea sp. PMI_226]
DTVILVMGLTGVGKSNFIERLTGDDTGVSHKLVSETTSLSLYCFISGTRRVFFIDTPGFDDTRCADTKVFQEIAFFLTKVYRQRISIGGIIYLHRITDNRVSGSAMRSFNLLKKICGPEGAKFAVLVTTMWDDIPFGSPICNLARQREDELRMKENYWGSMKSEGSRMQRWNGTRESALSIVTSLLWLSDNEGPVVLRIQKELVDEKEDLEDTSAGRELAKYHGVIWQRLQGEIRALKASCKQALEAQDKISAQRLEAERVELERQMNRAETAERDLREDLEGLFQSKTEQYRNLFLRTQEEVKTLSHQIKELQTELEALKRREAENVRLFEQQTRPYEGAQTVMRTSRKVLERNILSILGVLGGVATIAAGAATFQIPVVAAGIALVGTAGMKLDLSRKKKKEEERVWEVDDHTS